MQTSSVFPTQALTGGKRKGSAVKPASNLNSTVNTIQRGSKPGTVAPPKRRRQITAAQPKVGNPFGQLQGLVGKALKGQQQF